MFFTADTPFGAARAARRAHPARFALGVALVLLAGCQSKVQKTSVDIGGGMRKGDPPMCFQYRGESRPTTYANNIWLHLSNLCSYPVDCLVYDDVTEQQHRVIMLPQRNASVILASGVDANRVDLKLECAWKS
jgi:hypothetical protein